MTDSDSKNRSRTKVSKQADTQPSQRIEIILNNPGYRQADQDVDFLNEYETRGVRLQIDYQKAEMLLEQEGIQQSIVLFGSARLSTPKSAQQKLTEIESELENDPKNPHLQQQKAIALRILSNSKYYVEARKFGKLVGESGQGPCDCRLILMTGGGPGLMEAGNHGAYDVGAKSVGLNITLPYAQNPNSYVTPELCFRFHYFAMRKLHFVMRAKALVAFPGGYGTLDELFNLLTLVQTQKIEPVPIVLVGKEFWSKAINFDFLIEEGVIAKKDRELFSITDTAQEAWDIILQWYKNQGRPLVIQEGS
jgi:uncharacterized protein (TIGR00730 family)